MRKCKTVIYFSILLLAACSKSNSTGNASSGTVGNIATGGKDTLLSPYYFKADIDGITKNFTNGKAAILLDTFSVGSNDTLYWIISIGARLSELNKSDAILMSGAGFEKIASIANDLSNLAHGYSVVNPTSGVIGCSHTITTATAPLLFTGYHSSDSASNYSAGQIPFQLTITSFTNTEIKGMFSGLLLGDKNFPASAASETIANGQFDLPVTFGK